MQIETVPKVKQVFDKYPKDVQKGMKKLRQLIIETAKAEEKSKLVETLKWGEPAYVVKNGSTIRIDWKPKNPGYLAMYFICSTSLVSTFRLIFGDELKFEDNRAILLPADQPLPVDKLIRCITMALNYHKLKDLPLLGA